MAPRQHRSCSRRQHMALYALLLCCLHKYAAALPSAILEEVDFQAKQAELAPVGVPDFQAEALRQFAAGLAADPHGVLPLWTGDSHPCGDGSNNYKPWPGITCNAPTGFVTAIQLPNKGLSGTLPRSISVLKSLRILDLSNNSFFGSLPFGWSNLTSLETVDLSYNQLTGPLQPTWSAWDALQSLELHHNQLTGQLPGSWAGLNLLEVLDLSNNNLSGSLPAAWARMSFLSVLDLHNNSLNGTLPAAWAEQRSLLQLNLGANKIEGVLPPQWADGMDSLRGVNVNGNSLSGSLPGEWSNMTSLQALSVSHNQLTGSIPATWGSLHNLYAVNITRNEGICGGVPTGVSGFLDGNSTQLNSICMWETDAEHLLAFKAVVQDPVGVLAGWREGSNPCGADPWQGVICASGWVVAVRLEGSALRGPLTDGLVRLSKLQTLHLEGNQLEGTLPAIWGPTASPSLVTIDLSNNQIIGPLPGSWAKLTTLTYLDLSRNELEGQLPVEWGTMANLTTLLLGNNRALNGTLPAAWSGLGALQKVHLDGSNIAGSLPASWAKLTRMQEVGLSSNLLTGGVPTPWQQQMQKLSYLDLSGNQQMCGQLQPLSSNLTLHTSMTGLGKQCKAQQGISTVTAIVVGVCASFAGAALLAGTAYLVIKRKQQQAASSQHPPAAMTPTRSTIIRAFRSYSRGTPSPRQQSAPPCSPICTIPGAAGGSMILPQPQQHRLAFGTSPADTPPSPRSAAGPIAEAVMGLESNEQQPYMLNPLLQVRPMPGSPGSPRNFRLHSTANINTNSSSSTSMEITPAGSPGPAAAATAFPVSFGASSSSTVGDMTPLAASPSRPRIIMASRVGSPSGSSDPSREMSQSQPASPRGAWGSAVKGARVHEHGALDSSGIGLSGPGLSGLSGPSQAGSPVRASGMEGLLARVTVLRMAEAAAAEAAGAGVVMMDSPVTPIRLSRPASPALVGVGSPVAVGMGSPDAVSGEVAGLRIGSPVPCPGSPVGVLMGGCEGSVPSPRGVAALMAAGVGGGVPVGAVGSPVVGAGEALGPGAAAPNIAAAAAEQE